MLVQTKIAIAAGLAIPAYLIYHQISKDKGLISQDKSRLAAEKRKYAQLQAQTQSTITSLQKQIQAVQSAITKLKNEIQSTQKEITGYHSNNATIRAQLAKY